MHFSIPDTQELKDENATPYQAFNIHINGVLHCTLRYSQLRDLNDQIRDQFPTSELADFPPKKVFSLRGESLNERRVQLEKYIQSVGQNQEICACGTFSSFLHKAQQETRREETIPVSLDIFLMNGAKVTIDINSTDQTNDVIENVAACIGIPDDFTYYFGLYLMKSEKDGKFSIVRKLQDFESPYISMKALTERRSYKITIRKAYWDQAFDDDILSDTTTFNLLHVQALSDVEMGWTICPKDNLQRLESLQNRGSKRESLKLCRTLRHYGYVQFKPCITDFPSDKRRVIVSMGNYEIHFRVQLDKSEVKEAAFSVTRIRCWRASSQFKESVELNQNSQVEQEHPVLQLSFEYLVSKGNMKWISLISDQAIMMSMCIKDMVDELLRKRKGGRIKKPSDRSKSKIRFKPRDKSTEALFGPEISETRDSTTKKISEKISSVKSSTGNSNSSSKDDISPFLSNSSAFEGIGDDDL
ncbi:sorting nexin-17-like [Styela clava]